MAVCVGHPCHVAHGVIFIGGRVAQRIGLEQDIAVRIILKGSGVAVFIGDRLNIAPAVIDVCGLMSGGIHFFGQAQQFIKVVIGAVAVGVNDLGDFVYRVVGVKDLPTQGIFWLRAAAEPSQGFCVTYYSLGCTLSAGCSVSASSLNRYPAPNTVWM